MSKMSRMSRMSRMSPRRGRLVRDLASMGAAAVIVLSARASLADHYVVPSASMSPTVRVGDHIVVDKRAYGLSLPFTHLRLLPGARPGSGWIPGPGALGPGSGRPGFSGTGRTGSRRLFVKSGSASCRRAISSVSWA